MPFNYRKYLGSVWFVAIALALVGGIMYFWLIPMYTISIVDHYNTANLLTYHIDIDNDGTTERIDYHGYDLNSSKKRTCVYQRDRDGKYIAIWNHKSRYITHSEPLFTDWNKNGKTDLFTITWREDSIFLNYIDLQHGGHFFFTDKLIDKSNLVDNITDVMAWYVGEQDANGDGFNEIYFAINAGFSIQPRNIYRYDIVNDEFTKSPCSYSRLGYPISIFADINNDGYKEILLSHHASDNTRDSLLPYNDQSSWVMLLDKDLHFMFEPIQTHHPLSTTTNNIVWIDGTSYIYSYFRTLNLPKVDSLHIYSIYGKLLSKQSLTEQLNGTKSTYNLYYSKYNLSQIFYGRYQMMLDNGRYLEFDKKGTIVRDEKPYNGKFYHTIHYQVDDSSPEEELIIIGEHKIIIARNDLSNPAEINIDPHHGIRAISKTISNNNQKHINIQTAKENYTLNYHLNPYYSYRYFVFPLFWLIFASLFLTYRKISVIYHRKHIKQSLAAIENNRSYMARELHDELGSRIAGLRLKLENINPEESVEEISNLSLELHETHNEIRNIIHNLTPPKRNGISFAGMIQKLAENYKSIDGPKIETEFIPEPESFLNIPYWKQTEMYRIVQEALTNSLKHANASDIFIQITKHIKSIEIYFEDNGVGFYTKDEKSQNGMGLQNMQMRAKVLGGKFIIDSGKSKGTRILINIPYKKKMYERLNAFYPNRRRP